MRIGSIEISRAATKTDRQNEKNRNQDYWLEWEISRISAFTACLHETRDVPGAIVECGTGSGVGLAIICNLAAGLSLGKAIYSADSYSGFPGVNLPDTLPNIRRRMALAGVKEPKFIVGYFQDTLAGFPEAISFLHADVDLGPSYTDVLTHLWPKLSVGGVIMFDEYDSPRDLERWPDAKPAIDAYLGDKQFEALERERFNRFVVRKTG